MFFYVAKCAGFVLQPSALMVLFMGLACLLLARGATKTAVWPLGAAFALGLSALSPLPHLLTIPLEERFARADLDAGEITGVIVLGGAEDPVVSLQRRAHALNEAGERISELVALSRRLPSARLIFTGGSSALLPGNATEAEATRLTLLSLGIAVERLTFEDRSRDTWENAIFTKVLVKPKPGERWLLLTSAWHMPRAMGVFRAAKFPVEPWPVDYRTIGWASSSSFFYSPGEGLRRLDLITKEYWGLLAYWLQGRSTDLFPGP
jgi:uncharacterized SAM-binding protein YcdF (DUF218 family)